MNVNYSYLLKSELHLKYFRLGG